jgi:hypothetical protein
VQSGAATGQLGITSINGGAQTVQLQGVGASASISLITQTLNFGSVAVNQAAPNQSAVFNSVGTAPLTITGLSISGGASNGFTIQTGAPFTVQAGGSGSVSVGFTPTSSGPKTDTLIIATNDPSNPTVRVTLAGSGADNVPPTVSVQAPAPGLAVAGGTQFQVRFTATDNIGLGTFEVLLSTGGGFNQSLGTGTAVSGQNTFTAVAPTGVETTGAAVQVNVRDTAGNVGSGQSSLFVIGTPPSIIGASITTGKFKTFSGGSNIQPGAVLIVGGDTFGLIPSNSGTKFLVKRNSTSSSGRRLRDLAPPGATVSVTIRNPNGISSAPASITAR